MRLHGAKHRAVDFQLLRSGGTVVDVADIDPERIDETAAKRPEVFGDGRERAEKLAAKADVFLGAPGDFTRLSLNSQKPDRWTYEILEDTRGNGYWDPGETLYIDAYCQKIPGEGEVVYFQFVLSTGLSRSTTFTAGT